MSVIQAVSVAVCISAGALAAAPAAAQNYPVRPVRVVVPNAPGSSPDIIARLIAQPLSERLGQQVVVENRAGAGTIIGGEVVARSAPDGYTLLMGVVTLATNPALYKKLPYDALRDFTPITQAVELPGVLVAHPALPAKSAKELIALARARPGAIGYASGGQGSFSHLSTELFGGMAAVRMLHVPYKGSGPALVDLLAGHVSVMTSNLLSAVPHVQSRRLRALGVTSAKRVAILPDIPTVAEGALPGYESVQWSGLLGPAGMPREVITRLHKETSAVLRSAEVKGRLAKDGAETVASAPQEFAAYIRSETLKWARVVKAAGIQPE
jgi:tripartite-type tricarboxylate transporter receptor subunit TctC